MKEELSDQLPQLSPEIVIVSPEVGKPVPVKRNTRLPAAISDKEENVTVLDCCSVVVVVLVVVVVVATVVVVVVVVVPGLVVVVVLSVLVVVVEVVVVVVDVVAAVLVVVAVVVVVVVVEVAEAMVSKVSSEIDKTVLIEPESPSIWTANDANSSVSICVRLVMNEDFAPKLSTVFSALVGIVSVNNCETC